MTLLQDADNEKPESVARKWFDRLKQSDPALAVEIETFRSEWHKGKRRDVFPTISSAARFLKRPKYGIDVSVQEISKWFRSPEG